MADRYWSVNAGQDKTQVAEAGTSTPGAQVEVRVTYDNAAFVRNKQAVITALAHLRARIVQDTWPPV